MTSTGPEAPASSIACRADPGFSEWFERCGGALACSTYQAGKLLMLGWNGQQVSLLPRNFDKAMGVATQGERLALATRNELLLFANAPPLAPEYQPGAPGRYDAIYLPRASYFTADLNTHDIAFGDDGLWLVNTRFSCLARPSTAFSFEPAWRPHFVSALAPEDRCHLNGLALLDGRPQTVSALGRTDAPGAWRADKARGGLLLDVPSNEIVATGLCMPHSPRWHRQRLWVLNSGRGEVLSVDPARGSAEVVTRLPGYLRGMDFVGDHALIGLCKIREQHIFGGLPVQEAGAPLKCGIAVVDLRSGRCAGLFEFTTGVEEIFDLRFLPGIRRPQLLRPDQPQVRDAVIEPAAAYWLRPDKQVADPAKEPPAAA